MTTPENRAFGEFERAGWQDAEVAARYACVLAEVTSQSVDALLDAARVMPGSLVLDLATGPGHAAAAVAQRGGEVIGADFSTAQIELARRLNPALRFEVADAAALPFAHETFDAVVCGFGMLHFPDPEAAAREAFRVLKPGGRFAFTVWNMPERAVAFGVILAAIRAHGVLDVGLPKGPDFFQFSDPGRSAQVLRAAGFAAPAFQQVTQVWHLASSDDLFETLLHATVRTRAVLLAQTGEALVRIRAALAERLAAYRHGTRYELPMGAVLAAATKPPVA